MHSHYESLTDSGMRNYWIDRIIFFFLNKTLIFARIAQLVERDLAKVEVAGSNPVSRSISQWFTVIK